MRCKDSAPLSHSNNSIPFFVLLLSLALGIVT